MDFAQGLDPFKLVASAAVVSFLISPFTVPAYNLPIFLFGVYSLENTVSSLSLQLVRSSPFRKLDASRHSYAKNAGAIAYYSKETARRYRFNLIGFTAGVGLSGVFDIVWMMRNEQNPLIKVVSVLLLILKVPTFFASGLALRERGGSFGSSPNNLTGPPLWSMPGGYVSGERDGYQNVDEEAPAAPHPKPTLAAAAHPQPVAPGAYQTG